ncbi:MAG: RagB/SusD family nutrient uptake outer membrane protein [Candidatus Bipolaricaulia bacterium]
MKMLYRYFLVPSLALLLFAGCDVFQTLEQQPDNTLSQNQVFSDANGVRNVLRGLYNDLQGPATDYFIYAALASDQAVHTGSFPSWQDIDNHQVSPGNGSIEDPWVDTYNLINTANVLIARAKASDFENMSEEEAADIRAQARAIRAYGYHTLVQWYGGHDGLDQMGVPVITKPTSSVDDVQFPSRSTVGEVYNQIISDLKAAESAVNNGSAIGDNPAGDGFVDKNVVRGLLARAHLFRASIKRRAGGSPTSDYQAAADKAQQVIQSGQTQLSTLDAVYNGLNSSESIWELQFSSQDGNAMSFFARPNGAGGRFEYGLDGRFVSALDSLDDRRDVNIKSAGGQQFIGKYYRLDGSDHLFILRLPEMKLIRAEAMMEMNFSTNKQQAIEQVNDIRRRAYNEVNEGNPEPDFQEAGAEIDPNDVTSKQELRDIIRAERRRELAFEGNRWHDLNRLGVTGQFVNLPSETDRRWPVPQSELDVNDNLNQNPGY